MTPFRTTALVGALVAAAGAEFLIDGGETAGDAGYVAREKPRYFFRSPDGAILRGDGLPGPA